MASHPGELANHPYRLLVTARPQLEDGEAHIEPVAAGQAAEPAKPHGETYAEVAHEALFRRWDRLREWVAAEREFLAWRSGLEAARRQPRAIARRTTRDTTRC